MTIYTPTACTACMQEAWHSLLLKPILKYECMIYNRMDSSKSNIQTSMKTTIAQYSNICRKQLLLQLEIDEV